MDSVGAIIAVIMVAIGLLVGAGVISQSLGNTGDQQTFTETFDPGTNQTQVTLNQSNRDDVYYDHSVRVTDENAVLVNEGVDYQWHQTNGTLTVIDNGSLDGDANATIEYGYRVPSQTQEDSAELLAGIIDVSYALPLVFAVVLVIAALGVFSQLS